MQNLLCNLARVKIRAGQKVRVRVGVMISGSLFVIIFCCGYELSSLF